MVNNISEALEIAKEHPNFESYEITKAYESDLRGKYCYAFRLCLKGMGDVPGLSSFMIFVFEDGNMVSGSQMMVLPGGKEVPVPKL